MNLPSGLVVDASVAAKWFLPEADAAQAQLLLDRRIPLAAPDLLPIEVGSVLVSRIRGAFLTPEVAAYYIDQVASGRLVSLHPSGPLLDVAMRIAARYRRSVYDALYVALALAQGRPLVTADARLFNALQGTELASMVIMLSAL